MPLPVPVLDTLRFAQLVGTLRDRIPGQSKLWTDFNPSDPGITLLELWCWLAEMVLYRIDQISDRTRINLFKLILDPPEPVTAAVTIAYEPPLGPTPLAIPPGVLFASVHASPPNLLFETFTTTPLRVAPLQSPPAFPGPFPSPPEARSVTFPVRSRVVVADERLGVSDGTPDQLLTLAQGPVLIDPQNIATAPPGVYNPNPQVTVGGQPWEFVPDFLAAVTGPDSPHFMVEQLTRNIRFGNNVKGRIPPRGAEIRAVRYQIIQGKEVRVGQDQLDALDLLFHLPGLLVLDVRNAPAEGGDFIYPPEDIRTTGLRLFADEFRAITEDDFLNVATSQFNQAQDSIPAPVGPGGRVARAMVVAGKRLVRTATAPPFPDEAGAVSVVILPDPDSPADVALQPSEELKARVKRYLDRRVLVTTHVFVVGPDYVPISIDIALTSEPRTNVETIKADITARVREFFHPLTGGDRGGGWPIGREVYKSELFQIVESVAGVDHVDRITVNGSAALAIVPLQDDQLPLVTVSSITPS